MVKLSKEQEPRIQKVFDVRYFRNFDSVKEVSERLKAPFGAGELLLHCFHKETGVKNPPEVNAMLRTSIIRNF
jgi:hypothetical protein